MNGEKSKVKEADVVICGEVEKRQALKDEFYRKRDPLSAKVETTEREDRLRAEREQEAQERAQENKRNAEKKAREDALRTQRRQMAGVAPAEQPNASVPQGGGYYNTPADDSAIMEYVARSLEEFNGKIAADALQPVEFSPSYPCEVGRIGCLPKAEILQIIDATSALVGCAEKSKLKGMRFMVEGMDFTTSVDGIPFYGPQERFMQIVGTTQYTTVMGGTNTVFRIRPFGNPDAVILAMQAKRGRIRVNRPVPPVLPLDYGPQLPPVMNWDSNYSAPLPPITIRRAFPRK